MINYSIVIMGTTPGTKKAEITETKAYATAQMTEKMSLDDFAEHISGHNSPFSKGVVKGILTDAVSCLREQLLEGKRICLGDLGTFGIELASEGARTTNEFSAQNIKEVTALFRTSSRASQPHRPIRCMLTSRCSTRHGSGASPAR